MRRKTAAALITGLLALGASAITWDLKHREESQRAGQRPDLDLRLRDLTPPLAKRVPRSGGDPSSDRVIIRIGGGERNLEVARLRNVSAPLRPRRGASRRGPAGIVGPKPPRSEEPPPRGDAARHIVQPGDTLGSISSQHYGTARQVERIREANGLRSDKIQIGQVLEIPAWAGSRAPLSVPSPEVGPPSRRTHRVEGGETLISIARRELGNADRWREILELNGLERATDLREGQSILIPVR